MITKTCTNDTLKSNKTIAQFLAKKKKKRREG